MKRFLSLAVRTVLPLTQSEGCVLFDGNWEDIVVKAEAAGSVAAQELALPTNGPLHRGRVEVEVGPPGSPLAAWLLCTRRATRSDAGTALVEIGAPGTVISPAASLHVRKAYAAAYCVVLAEEVGAIAERRVLPTTTPLVDIPTPRAEADTHAPSNRLLPNKLAPSVQRRGVR